MTTKDTDTHNTPPATDPLALRLSEGLGPLPKPDVFDPGRFGVAWREEKVRAYAAQEVAAERERWQAHADAMAQTLEAFEAQGSDKTAALRVYRAFRA